MRTSKISQETTRVFRALSPNARATRTTRSGGRGLATFALGHDGSVEVKEEAENVSAPSTSALATDIEDVGVPDPTPRKRKRNAKLPSKNIISTVTKTEHETTWTSPGKRRIKQEDVEEAQEEEDDDEDDGDLTPKRRAKAKPKIPARRMKSPGGTEEVQPPSNWEELYSIVKQMRQRNPTAPVDTMGCEDLFWQSAPPKQKRYHTLTALMLSSQTKDTVTAAAMQRLHTELIEQKPDNDGKIAQSGLTVENVLRSDPKHLDSLIGKVGFHNNKTKFIKAAAHILRDEYDSDIPNTIEGLIRLPGVGPKMAYLCMSAAWGIDEGIGVDVHVHRITNLWGWHKTKNPEETRAWLESWLPRDKWHEINKMLVGLGQLTCLPIGRRCGECDLAGTGLCKSEIRGWKATERRVKKEKVEVEVDEDARRAEVVKREAAEETSVRIKEELAG